MQDLSIQLVQHDAELGDAHASGNGYFRAKLAQEEAVQGSTVPYTILRAAQFFEFIDRIVESSMNGDSLFLPPVFIQPESADDVVATLVEIALGEPFNGIVELAGPQEFCLDELVLRKLSANDDQRRVTVDIRAPYFGAELNYVSLTPEGNARIARPTSRTGSARRPSWRRHLRPRVTLGSLPAPGVPLVKKDTRVRQPANETSGTAFARAQPPRARSRACSALFFFPRGGSAQVARALARALPMADWEMTLATGSLGAPGEATNAASFYAGIDLAVVDYSPALELRDPLAARVPFQPSYEDRAIGPDRVFAAVDDVAYERLVAAWAVALTEAGAGEADLLHLHHLTPAHEAALRNFPALPIVGQLHGTELAFLRALAGESPPASWRFARAWEDRLRRWAGSCERLIVPPGAETEVADLLSLPRGRLHGLPSGVDLERFEPAPLIGEERRRFWRRWLVEDPRGWNEHGKPGTISYGDDQLSAFASEPIFLYLGRFTAVKRLPLLISAHAQVQARLERPCPLVLVGGHPGEWEGEHPLETIRRLGAQQVFLAGWRPHEQLPQALNASDVLVLPSVAEAFGLALIEAMACGLPVIACNAHGPAEIVRDGKSGWLVPPDDEQALAAALLEAASDPTERQRRGNHATIDARQQYGWTTIATQIARHYDELTTPRHRRARI